jgi:hypothetical protein
MQSEERVFIQRQTHYSVNNDMKNMDYIDLWSSAVWQFEEVNSCLKMAK